MEAALAAFTATGSAAGATSVLSTAGSLLSTVFSVGSALSSISAGNQQANAYKLQAEQSTINARIEKLNAQEKANEIRRNLISNIGAANAAYAARGVSIVSGTPEQARFESAKNAAINIDKARFSGTMAEKEQLTQARQYKASASGAKISGYGGAARSLASLLD